MIWYGNIFIQVGYMPQDISLYKTLTLENTFYFFGRLAQMTDEDILKGMTELEQILELPPRSRLFVRPLSPSLLTQTITSQNFFLSNFCLQNLSNGMMYVELGGMLRWSAEKSESGCGYVASTQAIIARRAHSGSLSLSLSMS